MEKRKSKKQKLIWKNRVFAESCRGFLLQQYLNWTWHLTHPPPLSIQLPESVLPPSHSTIREPQGPCHSSSTTKLRTKLPALRRPSWGPHLPPRCTRTQRLPSTTKSAWSSMLLTCPCLTTLTMMMWFWRTFLQSVFFTNLMRTGNMLRNWWSCRTNKVAKSSFRISRNQTVMTGRMGWMQRSVHDI